MDFLNNDNFDESLHSDGITIVIVGANWCPDCRRIDPVIDAMQSEYSNIKFFKIDFDNNEELIERLEIKRIPTLIFYKNAKEVGNRLVEPGSRAEIEKELKQIM